MYSNIFRYALHWNYIFILPTQLNKSSLASPPSEIFPDRIIFKSMVYQPLLFFRSKTYYIKILPVFFVLAMVLTLLVTLIALPFQKSSMLFQVLNIFFSIYSAESAVKLSNFPWQNIPCFILPHCKSIQHLYSTLFCSRDYLFSTKQQHKRSFFLNPKKVLDKKGNARLLRNI